MANDPESPDHPEKAATAAIDTASAGTGTSVIILAGGLLIFMVGLGNRGYENRDVSRYAQMVVEMRHAGTLVPTLHGQPYHEAMPLAAWLPCFVTWFRGALDPTSARLAPALASLATLLLTLHMARMWRPGRLVPARVAAPAAAAFGLNHLSSTYGRGSRIDMVLVFAVCAAVVTFLHGSSARSHDTGDARAEFGDATSKGTGWFLLSGGACALAIAAKGPLALLYIGGALGPWLLLEKPRRIPWRGVILSAAAALVLTAAWLIPYVKQLGPRGTAAFFDQFLLRETLAKFSHGYGKTRAWSFYGRLIPTYAPWSIPALMGLGRVIRHPRRATSLERLCAWWVLVPLIVLTVASGKHIRYVIPLLPALAMLAALELDRWFFAAGGLLRRHWWAVSFGLAALLGAGGIITIGIFSTIGANVLLVAATGLPIAAGGISALFFGRQRRPRPTGLALYLACSGLIGCFYAVFLPLERFENEASPYPRLARQLRPELAAGDMPAIPVSETHAHGGIDPSQLALHLGHWIDTAGSDVPPTGSLILTRHRRAGEEVRAGFLWRHDHELPAEKWWLLVRR